MKVDAILPAGGRIHGSFAAEAGAEVKALIPLGGRVVLERTITALRATERVERIVVIGAREIAAHPAGQAADAVLAEGGPSSPANILRGLEWLREARSGLPDRVLIVTTDLPFLTPEAITGFLDACPSEVDLCVPLIRRVEYQARFPGLAIRYVRLRDGEWTLGCAFLADPQAVIGNRARIEAGFAARKSQLAMIRLLGPMFIARFVIGRLTVADIQRRCMDMLGCTAGAVLGCAPELAFDIDRPQEYRYAAEQFAHDAGAPE